MLRGLELADRCLSQSSVSATSAACPRAARTLAFMARIQVRRQTSSSATCSACRMADVRASSNWPLSKSGMSLLSVAWSTDCEAPRTREGDGPFEHFERWPLAFKRPERHAEVVHQQGGRPSLPALRCKRNRLPEVVESAPVAKAGAAQSPRSESPGGWLQAKLLRQCECLVGVLESPPRFFLGGSPRRRPT